LRIRACGTLRLVTSKRIERLRDKLLERGQPTLHPPAPRSSKASPELSAMAERVRPFAEIMYLVLSADTSITERECDVLRGALRSLTEGALSSTAMNGMLREFEHNLAREGLDLRLDYLASVMYADRSDARLALGLATAAAEADRGLGPEERAVIEGLGERLGVSAMEMQELLSGSEPATLQ
jgi:tellurite resistance protein